MEMEIHSVGFIFSVVILGVLATGVIVSASLSDKSVNKKKKSSPTPSATPSLVSNFSMLNVNDSSQNLNRQMSKMGSNPYLNSSNKNDWSYGTYRGGNDYVTGCGC